MLSLFENHPARFSRMLRRLSIGASIVAIAGAPVAASAQAWAGTLLGTNEVPPNASPATGFAYLSLTGNTLSLTLNWSGLIGGNVTAGHIHCCTNPGSNVGVAVGFNGLPSSSTGSYSNTFDLTSLAIYTGSFVTNFGGGTIVGAQNALLEGLNSGRAYVNLHNSQFPGGEIRANLVVTPEPASMAMLGVGLLVVGAAVRSKRRTN